VPRVLSQRQAVRQRRIRGLRSIAAAAIAGGLLAATFAPLAFWPLAFIAVAPLIATCRDQRVTTGFLFGLISGSVACALSFNWVVGAVARLQEISVAAAVPSFAVFVLWQSLPFAAFGALVAAISSRSALMRAASYAGAWVLIEWLWPGIISWRVADAIAPAPYVRQVADIGGQYGVGLLLIFTNAIVAELAMATGVVRDRVARGSRSRRNLAFMAAAVPGGMLVYGLIHPQGQTTDGAVIRVGIVQAGSSAGRADVGEANEEAWNAYEAATRRLQRDHDQVDLIIWPETALRAAVLDEPYWRRRVEEFARSLSVPILLGATENTANGEFNVAFLFDPKPRNHPQARLWPPSWQLYRKRGLLPFGEFVPVPSWLLPDWKTTGEFIAGDSDAFLTLPSGEPGGTAGIRLGMSICYEASRAGFFKDSINSGAAILVNLSDDAWFDEAAAAQHLNAVRLRAVERNRWFIRASGSGISAVIDPNGAIVASVDWMATASLVVDIVPGSRQTLYSRIGDLPWVALAFILAAIGLANTDLRPARRAGQRRRS